jgi:MoaD family protein
MVKVNVKYLANIKRITGKYQEAIDVNPPQIGELLRELVNRYGEKFRREVMTNDWDILPHIQILVNGKDIRWLNRLNTEVQNGDSVVILPPVAGGDISPEKVRLRNIWVVRPRVGKTKFREVLTPCTGCSSCEAACSLFNEGVCSPQIARLKIIPRDRGWQKNERDTVFDQVICKQCPGVPPCVAACAYDALYRDEKNGAVLIDNQKCTLCRACERVCPYNAIFYSPKLNKMLKCTLCGGDPKCVKFCPVGALEFVKLV